jgi:hypothetical protein
LRLLKALSHLAANVDVFEQKHQATWQNVFVISQLLLWHQRQQAIELE